MNFIPSFRPQGFIKDGKLVTKETEKGYINAKQKTINHRIQLQSQKMCDQVRNNVHAQRLYRK